MHCVFTNMVMFVNVCCLNMVIFLATVKIRAKTNVKVGQEGDTQWQTDRAAMAKLRGVVLCIMGHVNMPWDSEVASSHGSHASATLPAVFIRSSWCFSWYKVNVLTTTTLFQNGVDFGMLREFLHENKMMYLPLVFYSVTIGVCVYALCYGSFLQLNFLVNVPGFSGRNPISCATPSTWCWTFCVDFWGFDPGGLPLGTCPFPRWVGGSTIMDWFSTYL